MLPTNIFKPGDFGNGFATEIQWFGGWWQTPENIHWSILGASIVTDRVFVTKVYEWHSIRESWVDSKLGLLKCKRFDGKAWFIDHEINFFEYNAVILFWQPESML